MLIGANRLLSQFRDVPSRSNNKEIEGVGFEKVLKASEGKISSKSLRGSAKASIDAGSDVALDEGQASVEEGRLAEIVAFVENKQASSFRLAIPGFMKDDSVQDPIGPLTSLDAVDGCEVGDNLCASSGADPESQSPFDSGGGLAIKDGVPWDIDWNQSKAIPFDRPDLPEEIRLDGVPSHNIVEKIELSGIEISGIDLADDPALDSPIGEEDGVVVDFDLDPVQMGQVADSSLLDEVEGKGDYGQLLSSAVLPDLQIATDNIQPTVEVVSDQVEPARVDKNPYFALSFSPDPKKKEVIGAELVLDDPVGVEDVEIPAHSEGKVADAIVSSKNVREDLFSSNPSPFSREASADVEVKKEGSSSFGDFFSSQNAEKEVFQGKSSTVAHNLIGNTATDYRPFISSTPGLPSPEFLPQRGAGSLSHGLVNVVNFLQSNGELRAQVIIDPPSLGRVEVQIHAVPGGALEASFSVDSVAVRDMIKAQVPLLQDLLAQQGISISQMSVDVRTGDGQRQRWEGSKGTKRGRFAAEGIDSLEDAVPLARIDLEQGILMWIA